MAEIGGGRYIPLKDASILPDIIVGGVTEELELEKIFKDILDAAEHVKKTLFSNSNLTEETNQLIFCAAVADQLSQKGLKVNKLELDNLTNEGLSDTVLQIAQCNTFEEAKKIMSQDSSPWGSSYNTNNTSAAKSALMVSVEVQPEQVRRVLKKKGFFK